MDFSEFNVSGEEFKELAFKITGLPAGGDYDCGVERDTLVLDLSDRSTTPKTVTDDPNRPNTGNFIWQYSWFGNSDTECGIKILSAVSVDHGAWRIEGKNEKKFAEVSVDRKNSLPPFRAPSQIKLKFSTFYCQ